MFYHLTLILISFVVVFKDLPRVCLLDAIKQINCFCWLQLKKYIQQQRGTNGSVCQEIAAPCVILQIEHDARRRHTPCWQGKSRKENEIKHRLAAVQSLGCPGVITANTSLTGEGSGSFDPSTSAFHCHYSSFYCHPSRTPLCYHLVFSACLCALPT